ncbi:MAG: carbon monoxide dehydrogenase subunit G [Hydrogenophaga sp.]|uniref:SRPBCC family protein n=1 Tax=Hydrogenophaga sp. TaxID=1904254 RepID=UPI002730C91E|nr:carbon monoxide dehydrogenase subunit G [Hydrogenophaga sp.]MDP2405713.1 carbon monoxide dehydrogenase subunit G [Hydrogenophaga sp.]MDZ4174497.1 carbon monoxide dehydrogenase subunit G [Hydrogenophaga sp.]
MEFSGEYRLPVAQQRVWEALNDPAVLQASIAGCQQLDKLSDTEFSAVVTTKVGPISATFRGAVELSDLDPPRGYTLTGHGQGGAAGFARMTARVSLAPLDEGTGTLLRYTAEAEIGGKLASVGSRLVQTVAKKNADDFFGAFARQLTGEAVPQAEVAVRPAVVVAPGVPVAVSPAGATGGGLGAPVPAWLVVFGTALGLALGYCMGLLAR